MHEHLDASLKTFVLNLTVPAVSFTFKHVHNKYNAAQLSCPANSRAKETAAACDAQGCLQHTLCHISVQPLRTGCTLLLQRVHASHPGHQQQTPQCLDSGRQCHALVNSVPVLDETVPTTGCHFAALKRVPRDTNAHAIMCLDGARHLEGVRPLPEECASFRVTCSRRSAHKLSTQAQHGQNKVPATQLCPMYGGTSAAGITCMAASRRQRTRAYGCLILFMCLSRSKRRRASRRGTVCRLPDKTYFWSGLKFGWHAYPAVLWPLKVFLRFCLKRSFVMYVTICARSTIQHINTTGQ